MKKNILKTMVKAILTTAMVATLFIGTDKEAQAGKVRRLTEKEVASEYCLTISEYRNFKSNGFLVSADGSVRGQCYFDHERYAADYPDLVAVLGQDAAALRNHYYNNGMAEGRVAYSMDGTVIAATGVVTAQPAMLALVNADREANGVAPLTWDEDLAVVATQRVVAVADNYRNSRYAHEGLGDYYYAYGVLSENAARGCLTVSTVNGLWFSSEEHHENRLEVTAGPWDIQQYAAASYIDPSTGNCIWVELFR